MLGYSGICPSIRAVCPRRHFELPVLIDHEEASLWGTAHPVHDTQALEPRHEGGSVVVLQHGAGNPEGWRALRRPVTPGIDFIVGVVARGIHGQPFRLHPVAHSPVDLGRGLPRFRYHCSPHAKANARATKRPACPPTKGPAEGGAKTTLS